MEFSKDGIIRELIWLTDRNDIIVVDGIAKSKTPIRAKLDKMVEEQSWICPIKEENDTNSYYSISRDWIVVPKKEIFGDMAEHSYYARLFHEMCHSLGREDRQNRFTREEQCWFGSEEYVYEEFICELVSAVLCSRYFVMKFLKDDSVPYIRSWINELENGSYTMPKISNDVDKACKEIIKVIEGNAPDEIFN